MKPTPSKVVAIGGSHEGLAAISSLIGFIPPTTGLVFAVAIDNMLDDARVSAQLSSQTSMPVVTVSGPVQPRPNHIYLARSGSDLTFTNNELVPTPPLATDGARCSVDRLFRCVADEFGAASVAVVAAGNGADGSIGLKLVKECGGVTFAQIPGESLPDEMSRVAIATGFVDFVLPLAAIASKLGNIEQPVLELQRVHPDDLLRELLILLRVRTGHDFMHYKRATLLRRVSRRMQVTSCGTVEDYLRLARREPAELSALMRDFMISVTNFFRDPDAFGVLEQLIVPRLFDNAPGDPVRVWVAGCASGEEVYSLAMLLLEKRAEVDPSRGLQIFATDIDDAALVEARAGRYPNTIAADVSAARLERFFTRDGDCFQVTKEMRELVLFASHNVLRDAPFSRLDLMTCRNLLIYLDRSMQEHVLRTAHFSLKPDRFLFLGTSENADTVDHLFEPLDPDSRIFQRQSKRMAILPSVGQPRTATPVPLPPRFELPASRSPGEIHHQLVERYAPPSILVNARHEIAHTSSRAHRYLEAPPGEPTRDVFQMVLPDLRLELRGAMYAARKTPGLAVSSSARVTIEGQPRFVRMGVQLDVATDQATANYLIWFEESEAPAEPAPSSTSTPPSLIEPLVTQLEDELRHAREQQRTTIEQYETLVEEMHASNEELQAINEELRSASEEIEASREETDSVNQELTSVNQELKHRIAEAVGARSDIANLMESSDVGVIFVDRELRIHRFTQRTREIFNILDSDVGRPLSDLTSKLHYADLDTDARTVLESLRPIDREVQHTNGSHYLVRVRPYRSIEDRIAGVVMTFLDVTAVRRIEDALRSKDAMLQLAERAAHAGIWELDHGGMLRMSPQCHLLYGITPSGVSLPPEKWMSSVIPEDRVRLSEKIAAVLEGAEGLDVEFQVDHPDGEARSLWMLGRKTDPDAAIAGITLDVTAARTARRALEAADRRKNEFIATLAHELRNPLSPLTLALDIQKAAGGNIEQIEVARAMMERQVTQLRRLVDDLLDISRVQSGRFELRVEPNISFDQIVASACEATRSIIAEQGHRLTVDVTPGITLSGDATRLTQVLVNLLTNAAKYTDPGGTITLTALRQDTTVTISVKDTGIGIAAELLPKVFDLFVQAEPLLTRTRGGIGIGLSLVKQFVVLHGGTITAHSDGDGKGSCFTVTLPLNSPNVRT